MRYLVVSLVFLILANVNGQMFRKIAAAPFTKETATYWKIPGTACKARNPGVSTDLQFRQYGLNLEGVVTGVTNGYAPPRWFGVTIRYNWQ